MRRNKLEKRNRGKNGTMERTKKDQTEIGPEEKTDRGRRGRVNSGEKQKRGLK